MVRSHATKKIDCSLIFIFCPRKSKKEWEDDIEECALLKTIRTWSERKKSLEEKMRSANSFAVRRINKLFIGDKFVMFMSRIILFFAEHSKQQQNNIEKKNISKTRDRHISPTPGLILTEKKTFFHSTFVYRSQYVAECIHEIFRNDKPIHFFGMHSGAFAYASVSTATLLFL